MRTVLGLIVVAVLAYLGAALYRISRMHFALKVLVTSGLLFFLLGLLLGPHVVGLLDRPVLDQLDLVINLGVGWVGLLFGLQFRYQDLRKLPGRRYLGAAGESLVTLAVLMVGIGAGVWLNPHGQPLWLPVLILAAVGSTSSPTIGAQLQIDLAPRGPLTESLQLFTSIDAVPALCILAVVFCFAPVHHLRFGPLADGLLFLGLTLGLGLVLGAVFHLMTLLKATDNQLLVIVLGLAVFCSGVASYLMISSLFLNFLVGLVVANRSPMRLRILRALVSLEKPIYLVLLMLAGALWNLPPGGWWVLVGLFVALRLLGKLLGGLLAAALVDLPIHWRLGLGSGLIPHSGMALAIALNFLQAFPGPVGDGVLSATLVSILVATLIGPWSLRRLLLQQGEVRA